MEKLSILARKATRGFAPFAAALAVFGVGMVKTDAAPKPVTVERLHVPTTAEIDTQENRQLAADIAGVFNASLATPFINQGATSVVYDMAKEPWKNSDVLGKLATLSDDQLPAAFVTMGQLPDLATQSVDLNRDSFGKDTWGDRTPDEQRRVNADEIVRFSKWQGQLMLLGGPTKKEGIIEVNPDSLWEKECVPELRYIYQAKRPGESNYDTLVRLRGLGEKALGPRSLKIVDALIGLKHSQLAAQNGLAVTRVASVPTPGQ